MAYDLKAKRAILLTLFFALFLVLGLTSFGEVTGRYTNVETAYYSPNPLYAAPIVLIIFTLIAIYALNSERLTPRIKNALLVLHISLVVVLAFLTGLLFLGSPSVFNMSNFLQAIILATPMFFVSLTLVILAIMFYRDAALLKAKAIKAKNENLAYVVALLIFFAVIFSFSFFGPSITGKFGAESSQTLNKSLEQNFTSSQTIDLDLEPDAYLTSFSILGNYGLEPGGKIEVWLQAGNSSYLVFQASSTENKNKNLVTSHFTDVENNSSESENENVTINSENETAAENTNNTSNTSSEEITPENNESQTSTQTNETINGTLIENNESQLTNSTSIENNEFTNYTNETGSNSNETEQTAASQTANLSKFCIETCVLPNLKEQNYTLKVEVEKGWLYISKLSYDVIFENRGNITNISQEQVSVVPIIKNAKGQRINAEVEFTEVDTESAKQTFSISNKGVKKEALVTNANEHVLLKKGEYNIKVKPQNLSSLIKEIELQNLEIAKNGTLPIYLDDAPTEAAPNAVKVYAIDPTELNFTEATVTVTAKGEELWKCKDWNFTEQKCYGEWIKIMDITPGQDYSFTLTPEDPAYAELTVQTCAAEDNAPKGSFADACDGTYPAACPTDLLSCNDNAVETHSMTSIGYAGVKISLYNSSVTDCKNITNVEVCYEWWTVSAANPTNCDISVDNDNGTSWSAVTTTCPPQGTPNPGVICVNVTSLDDWNCSNFFGPSGIRAQIKSEARRSSGAASKIISWDVLYFRVNYTRLDEFPEVILISPPNGNVTTSKDVNFTCNATDDKRLGNITFYWNYSGSWQANGTVNVSGTSNQTTFQRTNLSNGAILWNCRACDNAPQCSFAPANWTVTVNYTNTAPQYSNVGSNTTTPYTNEPVLHYVYWQDNEALSGYIFSSNYSGTWQNDSFVPMTGAANWSNVTKNAPSISGVYGWRIYANDSEGAWNVTDIQIITVQNKAPQVTLNLPANNTVFNNTQNINFNFTATDDQNITFSCSIYLDGTLNQTNSSTQNNTLTNFLISGISYGNHNWSINCSDGSLSNVSETRLFTIADTQPPIVTIIRPENITYNTKSNLPLDFTATDNVGISACWYSLDGGVNTSLPSCANTTFSVSADGSHSIKVYANDTSGNINSSIRYFSVDSTSPTYSNDSDDSSGSVVEGTIVNVSVLWQDNYELDKAIFRTNRSGSWTNVSTCTLSGTSSWCNKTIDTTGDAGKTICWNQWANDTAGNLNSSMPETLHCFNVSAANAGLQISLNLPVNNTQFNNTQNINFNFTATDDQNTTLSCSIYLDSILNQTNNSVQNNTLTNFLITGISYGSHNWSINCTDGSLSNVSETRYFSINDTLAPATEFVAPTTESGNYSQNWIAANVTANDVSLDTIAIYLYNSSSLVNSTSSSSSPLFVNFTSLPDGAYYLSATANDTAGNSNSTETRIIKLDTIAPNVYYNPNTDANGTYSKNWIFINITCSDLNKDTVILNWNGTNESFDNYDGDVYWENKTGLSYGTYTFYAWCNDTAGNSNSTEIRTIVLGTIAPSISILSPTNTTYNNATILVNISSDGDNIWYNWNGTNTTYTTPVYVIFNEGGNTLYAWANDSAGNLNSTSVTFTIDTTAPNLTNITTSPILPYYNNGTSQNITVNFTSNEYPINITFNLYYPNGSVADAQGPTQVNNSGDLPIKYILPIGLPEGNYALHMTVNDSVGNMNSVLLGVIIIDTTAPNIYFNPNTDINGIYSKNWIFVNVTATDLNLAAVIFEWNGANESFVNNSGNLYWENKTGLSDGNYLFKAYANDSAGNYNATELRNITIDTTAPSVTLNSPSDNLFTGNATITFNCSAQDATNLANITLWLNSSGWHADETHALSGTSNSTTFTKTFASGTYIWSCSACDALGNCNESFAENRTFTIDLNAPSINYVSPTDADGAYVSRLWTYINVTVSDANGVSACWLEWDCNNESMTMVGSGQEVNCYVNKTNAEGQHSYNVYANDTLGNLAIAGQRTITFDTTPPTIENASVTNITTNSATISWQTSENANSSINYGKTSSLGSSKENSSFVTNHSITLTGLDARTVYYFNITSCDLAGNCNTTGLYNFTTNSAPSGSEGYSGGGGFGWFSERNISPSAGVELPTGANVTETLPIPDGLDIVSVTVTTNKELPKEPKRARLRIAELRSTPTTTPPLGPIVYKYWEFLPENIPQDTYFSDIRIKFRVSRDWTRNSNINISSIVMWRYENGWHALPTKQIGQDENWYYFEAKAPNFSLFGVNATSYQKEYYPRYQVWPVSEQQAKFANIGVLLILFVLFYYLVFVRKIGKEKKRKKKLKRNKRKIRHI